MSHTSFLARALFGGGVLSIALLAGSFVPAAGQDVEMLGRMYGTTPPAQYFARRAAEPGAFEFQRALRARGPRPERPPLDSGGGSGAPGGPIGSPFGVVAGTFAFPVLLGLYSETVSPPHDRDRIQTHFFDGPNPDGTIPEFYAEASGGLVTLVGSAFDWRRSTLSSADAAGGSSGLGSSSRVAEFIVELLVQHDSTGVDWGAFDNDGPDGIPNSGDDDGFVDVLAVLHPTAGAECGGNRDSDRVWSHRWAIAPQVGSPFFTSTPAASGGVILVNDYTIQPAVSCNGTDVNQIGVFTHELGHGFGLPDLYAVGGNHAAAGQWDLMGTGSWGCPGVFKPARPCQMGAWTKSMLGWVTEVELASGMDHGTVTASPVLSSRSVYRIHAGDGSDDYFLVENRQRMGFDGDIPDPGILVWQVDPGVVAARWPANAINADPDAQGVRVVQADGRDQLSKAGGGRGDSGDIFPGTSGVTELHAGTNPSSHSNDGAASGVTFLSIAKAGTNVTFRLLTRFQTLALRAPGTSGAGLFRVDAGPLLPPGSQVSSAPFQQHVIEALPGDPLGPGIRAPFQAWDDGSPRARAVQTGLADMTLTATYAGRELEIRVDHVASGQTVTPGTLSLTPAGNGGWVPDGSTVTIEARANTGFTFTGWNGDLAGQTNPLTATVASPIVAEATYDVIFSVATPPAPIPLEAGLVTDVAMTVENGTLPTVWSLEQGVLPEGLRFGLDGHIRGIPLVTGDYAVRLSVVDGIGLRGAVDVELSVAPTQASAETLAAAFLGSGGGPTPGQRDYLDRQGNRNGRYDLGDFRAFLTSGAGGGRPSTKGTPATEIRLVVPVVLPELGGRPGGGR